MAALEGQGQEAEAGVLQQKQEAEVVDLVGNSSAAFPGRSLAWRRQVAPEWLCPGVSESKLALFPLGENSRDSFFLTFEQK